MSDTTKPTVPQSAISPPMVQAPADHNDERRRRRRKALALLSAGAILGVGAVVTLAVWNDPEFEYGQFATGHFDLQGSTDGTSFASHATTPGVALTFTLNPQELTPGDSVYAPFSVKLSDETTQQASVKLTSTAESSLGGGLSYALYSMDAFGCSSTAKPTGSPFYGPYAIGEDPDTVAFTLTTTSAKHVCFVLTADSALQQGKQGSIVWQMRATSTGTPIVTP